MTADATDTPLGGHALDEAVTPTTLSGRCSKTEHLVSVTSLFPPSEVLEQWRALSARALVPNLFYEPEFAQAASIAFGKDVQLLTIFMSEMGKKKLVLAWPFRISHRRWGVPLSVMVGWGHPFASLGVPLIDPEHAASAIDSLLNVHRTIPQLPPRAFLPLIPEGGVLGAALSRVEQRRGRQLARTEGHDRPYWKRGEADDPLTTLSSSTRSKLRQEFRHLERNGPVIYETITDPSLLPAALDDYLALEASGWKARAGTAIPQSQHETAFIRHLFSGLGAQGRVRVDRLRVGETTLASSINYLSGAHHAWCAKTSFNEAYAKSSPGSQLVLKVTEDFRLNTELNYADSCSPPEHPLMRKFWSKRFSLSNIVVGLSDSDPLLGLASRLELLRCRVRDRTHSVRRVLRSRLPRSAKR